MDFPTSPSGDDITSVVRMVNDFKNFVNRSSGATANTSLDRPDLFLYNRTASLESAKRKRTSDRDFATLSKDERADMIAAKSKVAKLEKDLRMSEVEGKKRGIEEERRQKMMSSQRAREQEECDNMRRKFKQVVEQKESVTQELEEVKNSYQKMKSLYEEDEKEWTREKNKLSTRLSELHNTSYGDISNLRDKYQRLKFELLNSKSKLEETETQLKAMESRYTEAKSICTDYNEVKYRCNVAESKVKTLQGKLSNIDESALIIQKSQQELAKYREVERENKRLKEENRLFRDGEENMLIMQEKFNNKSARLIKAESTVERLRKCEFENEELKRKLGQYKDRPKSEGELTRIISELQTTNINSGERNGELEVSVSILDATLVRKLEDMKELHHTTIELQNKNVSLDDKHTKLVRRLKLVTTERDGLRRVLSSYEADDGKATKVAVEEAENRVNSLQRMYNEIESCLDAMREENKQLKTQVEENSKGNLSMKDAVQLQECKKQMLDLRKELEKMKLEKEEVNLLLEKREAQGFYNPRKMQVLHLKNSIMQSAYDDYAKEIEHIREENERLRKKVMQLQKDRDEQRTEAEVDDTLNMSKLIRTSRPMEETKKALELEKLNNKKIVEQFAKTAKEYRKAIHEIFGYSFQQTKEGVYRVQSIFSPCEDDFFLFTCTKNKEGSYIPGIIQTEYTNEWTNLMNDYINKGDSIPAFLASVTLELFSQITEVRDLTIAQKAKQT